MNQVRANYSVAEIAAFRESGYIHTVLDNLKQVLGDEWEIYLYFELSKWKGAELEIHPSPYRKMVLCVGDESARTDYPFLKDVDLVFRTYLPENQRGKIYHIPVGPSSHFVQSSVMPLEERAHNVFFSGNLHRGRAGLYCTLNKLPTIPFAVLHRLKAFFGERFDNAFPDSIIRFSTGFHNGIAPAEYARILGDSKIVLCPSGIESPESMRHFEAASLGCIIISEPMPDVVVYRNAPFIILNTWRDLQSTVRQLLADPARMLDLHHLTLEWWRTTASPPAVADMILTHIQT